MANAVLSTIRQVMTFVGPLVGVVVALWSPTAGFAVNAATFAVSGAILATVRWIPHRVRTEHVPTSDWRGLGLISPFRDGFSVVRSIREMPPLVALIGIMYVVRGAEMVLHVYVVRDLLDASVDDIGLVGGAIGLGALVAMPIAAGVASSRSPVRPILASLVLTAVPTAALAVITQTVWACAVPVGVGAGIVVFEVVIVVMVQRVTPAESLGRVFGAINGASNTGKLAGAVAAPLLIAALGLEAALGVVAGRLLVGGVLAIRPLVVIGRLAAARQRELDPLVRTLAALEIFDGASEASLERIAAVLEPFDVPAGTVVIRKGDSPDNLYIAIDGSLSVSIADGEVGTLGANDWFGGIGLFDQRPRTATVTVVDDAMLRCMPGDAFLPVLEHAGSAPSALLDGIADRLASHR